MKEIIPAILEKDFKEIKNKLSILRGRVKTVQLDFCDGAYVPNQTWPFTSGGTNDANLRKILNEEEGMPYWQDFDFEMDLMVTDAVENFDLYLALGPKRVIFHLGAQKNLEEFEEFLEGIDPYIRDNIEIGVAVMPGDDLSVVARLAGKADFIQCMGIDRIGYQQEQFDEKVFKNLRYLRENLPGTPLSVDGGVSLERAVALFEAGADRLAVGSAIWRSPNPLGALESLESLVQ